MKTIGWVVGSLGLLFGMSSARAEDRQGTEITGRDLVNEIAQKPACTDPGLTVRFKTSSTELDTNAQGALNGVATWMKARSGRTLRLQGYADTTGNSEESLVLSEKRAVAVKDYLVSQGVDATRITTVGRGEAVDHLPANGRAVTFLACQVPTPPAAAGETPAAAEGQPPIMAPVPEPVTPLVLAPAPAPKKRAGFGWAVMAGGGYQDFTKSEMRDRTNAGGAWDVRFVGGTHSYLGFEGAYVGAARSIQTLGLTANNPTLVSNGLEGNLRINAPIVRGSSLIEPYGFAGVGVSRYRINNYNSSLQATSSLTSTDDVLNVPLGLGFAYGHKAFLADVRLNYTPSYFNNMLQTANGDGALNQWGIGGQVGYGF
jgi:hypothetical protein